MHFFALVALMAAPNVQVWVERGSNHESLANERFVLRSDGTLLIERGKPVVTKDPKYGPVTTSVCERFSWKLTEAQSETLRQAVVDAELTKLNGLYVARDVHDGSQAGVVAVVGEKHVAASFSNSFPPPFVALMKALRDLEATLVRPKKAARCDTATWFFLAPP